MPPLRGLDETRIYCRPSKLDGFFFYGWLRSDLLKAPAERMIPRVYLPDSQMAQGLHGSREIVEFSEIKVDPGQRTTEDNKNLITASVKFVGSCSISSNWNDCCPRMQFSFIYSLQEG